jgi:hypothetical protein
MAKSSNTDMRALRNLISEAHLTVSTCKLAEGRSARATELLTSALSLADHLIKVNPAAAALGAKGGKATAKRGPEYFKKIAAMRKTKAGGRPRKKD